MGTVTVNDSMEGDRRVLMEGRCSPSLLEGTMALSDLTFSYASMSSCVAGPSYAAIFSSVSMLFASVLVRHRPRASSFLSFSLTCSRCFFAGSTFCSADSFFESVIPLSSWLSFCNDFLIAVMAQPIIRSFGVWGKGIEARGWWQEYFFDESERRVVTNLKESLSLGCYKWCCDVRGWWRERSDGWGLSWLISLKLAQPHSYLHDPCRACWPVSVTPILWQKSTPFPRLCCIVSLAHCWIGRLAWNHLMSKWYIIRNVRIQRIDGEYEVSAGSLAFLYHSSLYVSHMLKSTTAPDCFGAPRD